MAGDRKWSPFVILPALLVVVVILVVLVVSGPSGKRQVDNSVGELPEYAVLRGPEGYGLPSEAGAKYWLRVQRDTTAAAVERLVAKEGPVRIRSTVKMGNAVVRPTELTFFIYLDPGKEAGKDIADMIYEWSPERGTERQ